MLSRLVITFLPRSKHLLISWLQSPSAVILEPKKIKSATVSTVSPSIFHEAKGKGEKERYTHLNAEFQRIARRDMRDFLSDQCKEIDENNRMGKTRDLFKKIRDTKGIFHAKMGTIKDRHGMYLTEAEDIKKRWQYTVELYRKDLHEPDNHDGEIIHLEPDILECEVKWALGSITMNKASGGDQMPVELFQILKYASKLGKLSSGHRTGKGQFSFQSQGKAMLKSAQTTAQLHSSHTLVK